MTPESKNPMDELLRASAQKRRADFGAEPKMPNPMRAQLHEEIARVQRAGESRPRRSWLAAFWPQVSIATAVAAVLATAAVLWIRSEADPNRPAALQVAVNTPTGTLTFSDLPPSPPMMENDEQRGRASIAMSTPAAEPRAVDALKDLSAGAVASAAAPMEAAVAAAENQRAESAKEVTQSPAAAPAAVVAAPAAAGTFAQTRTASANAQQRFSQNLSNPMQRGDANMKARQRAAILNTFDVEQEGARIRVVDEDGSTYSGRVEPVSQEGANRPAKKDSRNAAAARSAPTERNANETPSNEFRFRAVGFSNTLQKRVVFEGNYTAPAEPTAPEARAKSERGEAQSSARIIGTARISGEPPVAVDATLVNR